MKLMKIHRPVAATADAMPSAKYQAFLERKAGLIPRRNLPLSVMPSPGFAASSLISSPAFAIGPERIDKSKFEVQSSTVDSQLLEATCPDPRCGHQFLLRPEHVKQPGRAQCPKCTKQDDLENFDLQQQELESDAPQAAASSPTNQMDDATAVPIRFAPAPGKRTFATCAGRAVETTALHAPAAQIEMCQAWQSMCNRDSTGGSSAAQKMNSGYAAFLAKNRKH